MLVMVMLTWPAPWAGAVTVMEASLLMVNGTAVAPKLTAVADRNPVPVIVTVVPPAIGPATGVTAVMVGAAS